MAGVQKHEIKCPNCGKEKGCSEYHTRTGEYFFACFECGLGYEDVTRCFGTEGLADLRALFQGGLSEDLGHLLKPCCLTAERTVMTSTMRWLRESVIC